MNENNGIPAELLKNLKQAEEQLTRIKLGFSSMQEQEKALQSEADTMSLLVSSDDDLMSRYQQNLLAFQNFYPDIYDFFKSYEPHKYVVDAPDGFINAINVETGKYFYEYPSYLSTKLQFDLFHKSPNIKKFHFNSNEVNEANFIHVECLDKMLTVRPEKKDGSGNEKQLNKHFSSLIVFGVGAGYQLEMLAQQYNIGCLYIVEPDLDLFFLSLFSINWQSILDSFDKKGSRVYISLGEQKETFFDEFAQKAGVSGRYQMAHVAGYIHYLSDDMADILNEFNRRYFEMGQGWGFFDDAVMSIGHMLGNLKQKVPLLTKNAINNNDFSDTPVFIVGNGPSLDGLIDLIKSYQEKVIIISCGSALSALYQYGITPDFHCEQERSFPVAEKIEHYCPAHILDKIILLTPTTVHPVVHSMFNRSMMAAKQNEPSSALLLRDVEGKALFSSYHYINPTVANTALVMGYNLGFKNFYLFGIDLGHKKGGNHHSKKSLYYNDSEEDLDLYSINEASAIVVDGNLGGKFICDSFFYQSNEGLSSQILGFADLNCFNLSDGAKIKGSMPMSKKELSLKFNNQATINKAAIVTEVYNNSVYIDSDGHLLNRLTSDLDYQKFDDFCQSMVDLIDTPVNSFKDAADLLFNNTVLLGKTTEHIYDLLNGSVMHIQVTLTHLLYSTTDEQTGVETFLKGLVFYREFLQLAPKFYREQAEQEQYVIDSEWILKLRKKVIV